jgi:hypothetical protein
MLKIISVLLLLVMSVTTSWAFSPQASQAPQASPTPTQEYPDGIARITIEELKAKMDKKEDVIVLDVRSHAGTIIRGAIRIPLTDIEKNLDKLPKNKLIVAVCS